MPPYLVDQRLQFLKHYVEFVRSPEKVFSAPADFRIRLARMPPRDPDEDEDEDDEEDDTADEPPVVREPDDDNSLKLSVGV